MTKRFWFLLLMVVFLLSPVVKAQDDADEAIRRELPGDVAGSIMTVIELTATATVSSDERISAMLYRQEDRGNRLLAQDMDVKRCPSAAPRLPSANGFCLTIPEPGKIQLLFKFDTTPPAKNSFLMSFATIAITIDATTQAVSQRTTGGAVVQVVPESPKGKIQVAVIPVDKVFQRQKPTSTCPNNDEFVFTSHGPIETELKENVIRLKLNLPDDQTTLRRRVDALVNWLQTQKAAPSGIAEVKVERRDQDEPPRIFPLRAFTYQVQCPERLVTNKNISLFLIGEEEFPDAAFDFQIEFKNNPPLELAKILKGSSAGLGSVSTPKADDVGTDKTLALRAFDSNLNVATAFTSSVADVEDGDKTVRKRQNASAFDLKFAPWLNINLSPPRKVQHLLTPFFFDSKIASGKITKDTLALNRILIGSEYSIKYIRSTKVDQADKYVFRFRYINASDRDFKRIEGKFNFETNFLFAKLNQPLSEKTDLQIGTINPDAGFKVIPLGWFGYQFQPVVGVDLGRTFRRKRDVFDIEDESDFVRRLYFGGDMKFNLTRHFNLTLSDTFYVRGETPKDRGRNHFEVLFETPLGSIRQNAAQSIFFSFERGDEPPFNSPAVNAIKIGYRLVTNFGLNGSTR